MSTFLTNEKTEDLLHKVINDSLKKQRPGVVALEGRWGCGKSHLLNKVLNEWVKDGDASFKIVATYNAWEDDSGDKPIVPALFRLAEALDKTVVGKDRNATSKIYREAITSSLISLLGLIPNVGSTFQTIGQTFLDAKKKAKEVERGHSPFNNCEFEKVQSWSNLYKILGELCDNGSAKEYQIILVIDDLDRILPTRQMSLLESLYHLSANMRVLVIVALDPDQLTNTVKNFFGQNVDVGKYTEKIFSAKVEMGGVGSLELFEEIAERLNQFLTGGQEQFMFYHVMSLLGPLVISARDLKKICQELAYLRCRTTNQSLYAYQVIKLLIHLAIRYSYAYAICAGTSKQAKATLDKQLLSSIYDILPFGGLNEPEIGDLKIAIGEFIETRQGLVDQLYLELLYGCSYDSLDARVSIEECEPKEKEGAEMISEKKA